MRIAVLSGKGGSGKTLAAVNLAAAAGRAVYVDCDVEEPNGHLFFKPSGIKTTPVAVHVPQVTDELCTGCRQCVSFCRFNALAYIGQRVMVFEDICHACGGCALVCPEAAITEKSREIGRIEIGHTGRIQVLTGILNPGEAAGVPVIRHLLEQIPEDSLTLIDCPPGSACSVMESIQEADYCLLVAEPTIFGLHNLMMVHELVTLFGKAHGVLLNKCLEGENPSETYAHEKKISVVGRIPYDHHVGDLNARGKILVHEEKTFSDLFAALLKRVKEEVSHEAAVGAQR